MTAQEAGSFQTLGKAVRAAGLVELLTGEGTFTVFAPTDKAFAKLPKVELDALFADKTTLTRVLTYHLVQGRVKAPLAGSPKATTTVYGADLTITAQDGGFRVNEATVVKTDLQASNGVIHAIDTVLMPH